MILQSLKQKITIWFVITRYHFVHPELLWIYPLVFTELHARWSYVVAQNTSSFEPPMQFRVFHCLRLNQYISDRIVLQAWLVERDGQRFNLPRETAFVDRVQGSGRFYKVGMCCFYIFPGQAQLQIDMSFGGRHGEGDIYRIEGQGRKAKLKRERLVRAS